MTKTRNPSKPISDDDRTAWALARYEPFSQGGTSLRSLKDLAAAFRRDQAVISRGIQDAFSRGCVKIVAVRDPERVPLQRNDKLEKALLDRFDSLKSAIVVDIEPPPSRNLHDIQNYSDKVHHFLGAALARAIATNPVDLDEKRIALSNGRGVRAVAEELGRWPRLRSNGVRVLSLTGNMFFQAKQAPLAPMDADRNAQEIITCFPSNVTVSAIGMALAHPPKTLKDLLKRTWLGQWKTHRPDYAILGVGVLAPGHRFWEYASKAAGDELDLPLSPISQPLQNLVKICNQISDASGGFSPAADIANRLFYVDPPEGVKISRAQREAIIKCIRAINRNLLTVREDQIREVRHLMVVAGTNCKAAAIRKLLLEYRNCDCLVTDSICAKAILSLVY